MFMRYLSVTILAIFSLVLNAQGVPAPIKNEELEKLKSPQATMRTFIEAMDQVKKNNGTSRAAFEEAASTLNLSAIQENVRSMTGRMTAERLVNTLDRIAKIDYTHIPKNSAGSTWYFRKQTIPVGDTTVEAEIAIGKDADGAWRFTPETVSTIETLYDSVSHLEVVSGVVEYKNWKTRLKSHMPEWTSEEFLMFTRGQWLGFLLIFIFAIIALSLMRFLTTLYIRDLVRKEQLNFKEKEHYKATLPFGLLAFSLVCMGGIRILDLDIETYARLVRAFYILIALTSVWSAVKIVDIITLHFVKIAKDTENKFDDVLVPMLSKTAKVVVIALGAILVAHSLTFDIGSILAGLGIGGVAVALAAKDTISNLFGSVTVIMDRPFLIGDYVMLDKSLEGTIEEVGFRSTRIRTPHQSLVSIPNNVLANMAIDNYGMRGSRRFKTFLQMDYATPIEKLEEFCDRLRYMCKIHPVIDPLNAQVHLNEISDKSVNILLTVFFRTREGSVELEERHKLILEILKLAQEIDVHFAFPTNTMLIREADELQNFKAARVESTSL
jgi:MscS family membrane protein